MPALSIIPFVVYLVSHLTPELQKALREPSHIKRDTLTPPVTLENTESLLMFSTKLGLDGPVPLFAQLERSMSNHAIIYHQYRHKATNTLKKAYLYIENCAGDMLLTEDKEKATTFRIRNEDDETHGANFHISCLRTVSTNTTAAVPTEGDQPSTAEPDMETTSTKWIKLALTGPLNSKVIVPEDYYEDSGSNGGTTNPLIGIISPYYVQNRTD